MAQLTESVEVNDVEAIARIAENVKLPPQPSIVMTINRELQQDNPDLGRIAEFVSRDTALSAKVLKIVNSPLYGLNGKIDSVDQAVFYLGLNNFYIAVMATALRDSLEIDPSTENLWRHSQVVARLCRHLADITGQASPNWAYMTGLFHDAAIPLLVKKDKEYKKVLEMVVSKGGPIQALEEENFNTSHAVLSYLLSRSWGQPEAVCEAILSHHGDELSTYSEGIARSLAAMLMLADHMARLVEQFEDNVDLGEPSEKIKNYLNLDDADIDELKRVAEELSNAV